MAEPASETKENDGPVDAAEGMGRLWDSQNERPMPPMKFNTPFWFMIKAILAVIILTTIYLLYSLKELSFGLFGSIPGLAIFAACPFFVGWTLGLSFMSVKRALIYALPIGFSATFLALVLFQLPYRFGFWEFGPGYSNEMWWYWLISFFNLISFVPAGAAVAASTNAYD